MRTRWILPALTAIAAAFGAGCTRTTSANSDPPPAKIEAAPDPNVYQPGQPERFPLAEVGTLSLPGRLETNCVVAPDVERTVHVTSLSGGRVVDIRARLGDEVRKGQTLVVIHSPDLATAIAEYKKAQADEALARKALDRAQILFDHGAAAQKEVEQAEDADAKAKVDVAAAVDRIRILGGDPEHLSPVIEVKSPASGVIVEQNTTGGEGVKSLDNSPSLFTVADLSRVWVMCDVYENDLADLRLGDSAEVRLNAYPDRPVRGRVTNISPLLDQATRSAKVRLELANGLRLMRPGMFAAAQFVSRTRSERLVTPASAILRLHDRDWVFRAEDGGRFRRTEVKAGAAVGSDRQEILSGGVRAGDRIVANALEFTSAMEQM